MTIFFARLWAFLESLRPIKKGTPSVTPNLVVIPGSTDVDEYVNSQDVYVTGKHGIVYGSIDDDGEQFKGSC